MWEWMHQNEKRDTPTEEIVLEHNDRTEKEEKASAGNGLGRVSSPDQLTDYLRVTNPGIWVLLASIVLLLAGIFVWFSNGTLETVIPVKASVEAQRALVIPEEAGTLAEGMPLRIDSEEYALESVETDEYGRSFGIARVALPDGLYSAQVVTEQTHPIRFLLESR